MLSLLLDWAWEFSTYEIMALRRLSLAHNYFRATASLRTATSWTRWDNILGDNKPMCPGNAFTLFLETQPRNGMSLKKYVHEAACKWNTLSQEDKKVFQLKAKELEERYKKEILEWEIRMLQSDRKDVVQRHHQLTDGKNLAIQRSRQPLEDQDQDSTQTMREENALPVTKAVKEVRLPKLLSSNRKHNSKNLQRIIVISKKSVS